jgi:hypothetical protein
MMQRKAVNSSARSVAAAVDCERRLEKVLRFGGECAQLNSVLHLRAPLSTGGRRRAVLD